MPKKYINKTTCQLPLSPLIKKKLSSSLQWDKNYQVYHFSETGGGGGGVGTSADSIKVRIQNYLE